MTQRELGEAIGGVSDETISRIERQEVAGILAKRLPKLASVLGLTLEEFKVRFCLDENRTAAVTSRESVTDSDFSARWFGFEASSVPRGFCRSIRSELPPAGEWTSSPSIPMPIALVAASDRRAFTAPVDGDCQHPKWKHGEIVVFSFDAARSRGNSARKILLSRLHRWQHHLQARF